jgi:inner membrane protein
MDLFSHALLPYLFGNSSRLNIDIFILWINFIYPTSYLITHRGITHSLFFGFFTGIAVLYLATNRKIKATVKRFIDFEPLITRRTIMFAYAGIVLHLFLDYVTTRGVPLFYPFDPARFSAEVFFYTDVFLTILSLAIIIILYRRPQYSKVSAKFLVLFLIVFAGLGALRLGEKNDAEAFFQDMDIKAYPTMSPFDWYVLGEDEDTIKIYDYKGYEGISEYDRTFPKITMASQGEGLNNALDAAGELPQVKMFKWRAYSVALNASSNNGTWHLEYYDPLQRSMMRNISLSFRRVARSFGSLNVTVEGGRAFVAK